MSEENKDKGPGVKQGAVTPGRLRVERFRGAYRDAKFDDDGVSEGPVSAETAESLRKDFPGVKITSVKEEAKE